MSSPPAGSDLRALARIAETSDDISTLVMRGLEWLARVAPYELAAWFEREGDELVVREAHGALATSEVRGHRVELVELAGLERVLADRRARSFDENHPVGRVELFEGVLDLPLGHASLAAPMSAGRAQLGALVLVSRICPSFDPETVGQVEVYAQLLTLAVHNARQRLALEALLRAQDARLQALDERFRGRVGETLLAHSGSAPVQQLAWRAQQVARTDSPVLLVAEPGAGTERLARAVHAWSDRRDQAFVAFDCGAAPVDELEVALVGRVRRGDEPARQGLLQRAAGGSLLLSQVECLPEAAQAQLLRVLQERRIRPLGGERSLPVDVRILAATTADLEQAVDEGRLRGDLFHRLAVFPLALPPLRARLEDLPRLAQLMLADQARRTGRAGRTLSPAALARLREREWPGNLRELALVLERAALLSPGMEIPAEAIERPEPESNATAGAGLATLAEVQAAHIRTVLRHTEGRIYGAGGAAEILGLKPSTLQSRMKKLGVRRTPKR